MNYIKAMVEYIDDNDTTNDLKPLEMKVAMPECMHVFMYECVKVR
jgi:hypothetical protein